MLKRFSSVLKPWVAVMVGALVLGLSAFFLYASFPGSTLAQTPTDPYPQKVQLVPGPVANDLIYLADPITISYNENATSAVTSFTSSDPDAESARIEWAVTGPDADDFQISSSGELTFKKSPDFEKPTDRGFNANLNLSDTGAPLFDALPDPLLSAYLRGGRSLSSSEATSGIDYNGDGDKTDTYSIDNALSEKELGIDIDDDGVLEDTATGISTDAVAADQPPDEGAKNNIYLIVVRATEVRSGATGPRAESTATQVRVVVNDVDEDGEITLQWRQPEVTEVIRATLTDKDVSSSETLNATTWTWYTSRVDNPRLRVNEDWVQVTTGSPTNVDTGVTSTDAHSRIPQTADIGRFLRVKAAYSDTQGTGKTAYGMSEFAVRKVPASNGSPDFGQGATVEITVPENRKGNVGDAVTATDRNTGDHLTYELLAYNTTNSTAELPPNVRAADETRASDVNSFKINPATGQLSTPGGLNHENGNDGNYVIIVKVTDPSGDSDAVRVTVTASDVDDPPKISKPAGIPYAEHHVNEENSDDVDGTAGVDDAYEDADFTANYHPTGAGHNTYTAADQDDDLINWTIDGPDKADFKTCGGGTSCTINFKNAPDFDAPADANGDNVYQIKLVARSTTLKAEQDVNVIVHNVNEIGSVKFSSAPHIGQALTASVNDPDGARMSAAGGLVPLTDTLSGYPTGRTPDGGVTILSWEWSKAKSPLPTGVTTAIVSNDAHWTPIQDATTAVYTPIKADKGKLLRVKVVYVDPMGPRDNPGTAADERIGPRRTNGIPWGPRTIRMATSNSVRVAPGAQTIPVFPQATYTRSVAENARMGDYVGDPVVANDPDNGSLTYSLSGTSGQATYFNIDNYGQITVAAVGGNPPPLNFEGRPKTFTLTVSATDEQGNTSTSPATLTINLTDLNEAPVFDTTSRGANNSLTKTVTYNENGTAPVFNFSATDPEDATIRWSLAGADAPDFTINNNGELRFDKSPNFEAGKGSGVDSDNNPDLNMYKVTVRATETAGAQHAGRAKSSEISLTVNVQDVDEKGNVRLSLLQPEGANDKAGNAAETGTPITATTTDPDGSVTLGDNPHKWYRSKTGNPTANPANNTELNRDWQDAGENSTGASYTPKNGDVGKYLLYRATYTDGTGTGNDVVYARSHTVVRVSDDASNSSPEFPTSNATIALTISESAEPGATVGTIAMTSVPSRDTLTYDLYPFTNEGEGNTVSLSDFPSQSTQTDIYNVSTLGPLTPASIDVTAGKAARDDTGFFSINRATGQITLKSRLNHERTININATDENTDQNLLDDDGEGKYIFFVRAKNSSNITDENAKASTAWVKVVVTASDVNEKPIVKLKNANNVSTFTLTVREANSSLKTTDAEYYVDLRGNATAVTTDDKNLYTATDPEGASPSLTIEGADAALFRPKSVAGGLALHFKSPPDYDAPADADKDNVYHVTVAATDGNNNKGTQAVTVTVTGTGVDDPATGTPDSPVIEPEETGTLTLTPEQPLLGSMVTASLNDPDGIMTDPNGTDTIASLQWYWTSTDVAIDNAAPFEGITTQIVATDPNPASNEPKFGTVNDLDGSDANAYYFIDKDGNVTTDQTGVLVRDADADTSTTADRTEIAGKLNGATTNTYETKKEDIGRYLHVLVAYRDGSNPEDDPATTAANESTATTPLELGENRVVLKITDNAVSQTPATATAPTFSGTVTRAVAELTPRGGYVGAPIMAEDADVDKGLDELTYTLSGTDARYFDLLTDPNKATRMTGQIRVKEGTAAGQLDAEGVKTSYSVSITATDSSGGTATTPVTITIGDVNEAPDAPAQSFGIKINGAGVVNHPENQTDVSTYRAAGTSDTVTWSKSGADSALFAIDGSTGVLSFLTAPDFETPGDTHAPAGDNEYKVTVTATSGSGANLQTDSLDVFVTVTNVEEAGTVAFTTGTPATPLTTPQVGTEITATLTDPDGNPGDTLPIAATTAITTANITSWQWARETTAGQYTDIATATTATYTPVTADDQKHLRVTVMYNDGEGTGKTKQMVIANTVGSKPAIVARYDADRDGTISPTEMLTAIRDYFATGSTITAMEMLQLVAEYFSQTSS